MIGLVTIGESPRNDVVQSMFQTPPPVLIQAGALDRLSRDQVDSLSPTSYEPSLVSVLRDGSEVRLSKKRLIPHLQQAIIHVERQGATTVCVLCTGTFNDLYSTSQLIFPDQILRGVVDVLLPEGILGLLMPEPGQVKQMEEKWRSRGRSLLCESASPYSAPTRLQSRARTLADHGADLIVMDCMGYTRQMQAAVRSEVDVPVLLSSGVVGGVLNELIGPTDVA